MGSIFSIDIRKVENQTLNQCLVAVRSDPMNLQYVKLEGTQYYQVCKEAFDKMHSKHFPDYRLISTNAIELYIVDMRALWDMINNPTEEIVMHAILRSYNSRALRFSKYVYDKYPNKTDDFNMRLLHIDPFLVKIMDNLSIDLCEWLVTTNACNFRYIKNQTISLLVTAICSLQKCTCGCLARNPQSMIEEALFLAAETDSSFLESVTFSNGYMKTADNEGTPIFKLDDNTYIKLLIKVVKIHGEEKALRHVHNNLLKTRIKELLSQPMKNARNVCVE